MNRDGDIINIDVTVIKDGWHVHQLVYYVGEPSVMARRLVETTRRAMFAGIHAVRPGATLGDVGHAIQQVAEAERFSVVREYCGHGIGKVYHDEPQVLHYGNPGEGLELKEGMTFTIEPMINEGKRHTRLLPDGWTVVTRTASSRRSGAHGGRDRRRGGRADPHPRRRQRSLPLTVPTAGSPQAGNGGRQVDDAAWAAEARVFLAEHDEDLARRFDEGEDIDRLLADRANAVDAHVRQAWARCIPAEAPLALFAVGGYGRGELFPYSDIDLLALAAKARRRIPGSCTAVALLWDAGRRWPRGAQRRECTRRGAGHHRADSLQEARPRWPTFRGAAAQRCVPANAAASGYYAAKLENSGAPPALATADNRSPTSRTARAGCDVQTCAGWQRVLDTRHGAADPLGLLGWTTRHAGTQRRALSRLLRPAPVAGKAEERLRFDRRPGRTEHVEEAGNALVEQMIQGSTAARRWCCGSASARSARKNWKAGGRR